MLWQLVQVFASFHQIENIFAQYADGESNKIVYNKKKTVTAWKYNTYWVRNHFLQILQIENWLD